MGSTTLDVPANYRSILRRHSRRPATGCHLGHAMKYHYIIKSRCFVVRKDPSAGYCHCSTPDLLLFCCDKDTSSVVQLLLAVASSNTAVFLLWVKIRLLSVLLLWLLLCILLYPICAAHNNSATLLTLLLLSSQSQHIITVYYGYRGLKSGRCILLHVSDQCSLDDNRATTLLLSSWLKIRRNTAKPWG